MSLIDQSSMPMVTKTDSSAVLSPSPPGSLRFAIPAAGLIVVFVALAGYSHFVVQPQIDDQYRDLAIRNLVELDFDGAVLGEAATFQSDEFLARLCELKPLESDISTTPFEEKFRVVGETELCFRRLSFWSIPDPATRYQAGVLADKFAQWYRQLSVTPPTGQDLDEARYNEIVAMSQAYAMASEKESVDAMTNVARGAGALATSALVWLARRELNDATASAQQQLISLCDQLGRAAAEQPSYAGLASVKAMGHALLGVSSEAGLSLDFRRQQCAEASAIAPDWDSGLLVETACIALAMSVTDRSAGQDLASEVVNRFYRDGDNKADRSLEDLQAIFRSLLLQEKLGEASGFVGVRLKKLNALDQTTFKAVTAKACLEQLFANAIRDSLEGPENINNESNAVLLELAIRLNPAAEGISRLFIDMASQSEPPADPTIASVAAAIDGIGNAGLKCLLEMTRLVLKSPAVANVSVQFDDGQTTELADELAVLLGGIGRENFEYGVAATRIVNALVGTNRISNKVAIVWFRAINDRMPANLSSWYALGNLHMNLKQFALAEECFRCVALQAPDNLQIQKLLQEAESRRRATNSE